MSDVTAVLFTIGEPYAQRAVASVRRQTQAPADLVVIGADETPFHRAFNAGARQARTDFFLQVDADLVLDPDCVEGLRACMRDEVGLVTGRLRDPLLGRIGAVRLFRTACFERQGFPDTISPDTDFVAAIEAAGWRRLDALRHRPGPRELWHTFGEHQPDYSPLYTFAKFRLDGGRYRYRRDPYTLRDIAARLHRSRHGAAPLALVALMHGVFHRDTSDQLRPYGPDADFALATRLLSANGPPARPLPEPRSTELDDIYEHYLVIGAELSARGESASVRAALEALGGSNNFVALLAFCHGLFRSSAERGEVAAEIELVKKLLNC
jgi:hypothetical protein